MTEGKFTVEFKFYGREADTGRLDGSDHLEATKAARRLLALNAYVFFHGKLPHQAESKTDEFHVFHVGTFHNCISDVWEVAIPGSAVAVGAYYAKLYSDEVKQATNAAARFLRDIIRAALGIGSLNLPEMSRIEPVLPEHGGNGAPIMDVEEEQEKTRTALRALVTQVLHELSRPVGRSAERLDIYIDRELVATIDATGKAQLYDDHQSYLDEQITSAVKGIRVRQNTLFPRGRASL